MMRKQPTLAESNMDVGRESRSLKVKISICRIVTKNLVLQHVGFDSTKHYYVDKQQPFLWIWDLCAAVA